MIFNQLLELVDENTAIRLLDPGDKQNVPATYTLLQKLVELDKLPQPQNPTKAAWRNTLVFYAKTLSFFFQPFVDSLMNIEDAVASLSTYAHLLYAIYKQHRFACITSALYYDSMSIVRSVCFTIAKLQTVDIHSNLKFYSLFESTDREELLFSDVRTQDHAQNVDILQLTIKLADGALTRAAFQRNSNWDHGHCRLSMDGALGVDHNNPKSWKGKVEVSRVVWKRDWLEGPTKANQVRNKLTGKVNGVILERI
ncbi:hypothetical protein EV368DRAFT_42429 [Lentinula lateritia]|uniref:Uncharacterized protein n=1 Tax=Lentinula aff. lateritia TaxID=2804960 RepID=A0ACC1THW7_9AGAR|nr:hypothetical protein F5876DRAFT_53673 [Lentinula aff. lateritia]KAJ3851759.1 hypothetical protein EV368DRAFT_42429 [Lentinula lateritia]